MKCHICNHEFEYQEDICYCPNCSTMLLFTETKTAEMLDEMLKRGDQLDLLEAAYIYINGNSSVKVDASKGFEILYRMADAGDKEAAFLLGHLIYSQKDKDASLIPEAVKYLKVAAEQNHPSAAYELGTYFVGEKDLGKALHYYEIATCCNNHSMQLKLALNLYYTKTEYHDDKLGIEYCLKAARQGYPLAMTEYANFLLKQNKPALAYDWYKASADKGDFIAQYNFATLTYHNNVKVHGTKPDNSDSFGRKVITNVSSIASGTGHDDVALEYYLKAYNNSSICEEKLANLGLWPSDVHTDIELLLMRQSSDVKMNVRKAAPFEIATIYQKKLNYEEAEKYYKIAAELGYVEAMYQLGLLYKLEKTFPSCDDQDALYWFKKAAACGHAEAEKQVQLANQYK